MLTVELIAKKQRGEIFSAGEISLIVGQFTRGEIPDYQMAALLMAIYFRGLNDDEGRAFLSAMIASGVRLSLDAVPGIKVDKHSTGGVGDKTSLIIAPVVAAAEIPVPMISGRALGHTGGTLDKLESIPGFRVRLDDQEFMDVLKKTGCAFGAQTDELVPADRKLYALRDVTSTVAIPPLIASSILSKKIAEGTNALVMDVKVGPGGFLEDEKTARELSEMLVRWSAGEKVTTVAFGTDMHEPLGKAAGNAPEVLECLDILKTGIGDTRLIELSAILGGEMFLLGGKANSAAEGKQKFLELLKSGAGFKKFKEVAVAQGASASDLDNYGRGSVAKYRHEIRASKSGTIQEIHPRQIGFALVDLGAGRVKSSDPVDHTAGIVFEKRRGDKVFSGELLATAVWSGEPSNLQSGLKLMEFAFEIADGKPEPRPLIQFVCDSKGFRNY